MSSILTGSTISHPPEIRRLSVTDLALARDLNRMFGRAFADPETYEGSPPDDMHLAAMLGAETNVVLVAMQEGEVIGGLVAYALDKLEQARRELYIYDLAVAERHRRRGVATALIEHLRGIAAQTQAWVIFIQADLGDTPAIALYDKLGKREEVLHFDIAVGSPS